MVQALPWHLAVEQPRFIIDFSEETKFSYIFFETTQSIGKKNSI
jgi:hypothetical protein